MPANADAVEMASMDDSKRAANNLQYKVTKDSLKKMVDCYRQRKYIEDITYMKDELNGSEGLRDALQTSIELGATTLSIEGRKVAFGSNHKEGPQRTKFCDLLLGALDDFMLKILIVCAIFSIVVDTSFATPETIGHAWVDGTAILFAVAVVSGVTAWSDYKKEGQFLKQQQLEEGSKISKIMRDSKEVPIHRNNIVVGDIIKIETGMNIPVDGIVLEGNGVLSDESAMTGESLPLFKESLEKCISRQQEFEASLEKGQEGSHNDVPSPVLLSGTQIQTGQGWFVCIVVGDDTCEGQIMALVGEKPDEDTPLQQKLDVIAVDIGKLGMYAALLIIHVLLLRSFIEGINRREFDLFGGEMSPTSTKAVPCSNLKHECTGRFWEYIKEWLGHVIVGVAIIVVAVPEGLPLAVMISLAYSVSKMLEDQNFVKRLSSCEIMGGANNICSDKTGTLTKNQMTLTDVWSGQPMAIPNVDGTDPIDIQALIPAEFSRNLLNQAISCNSIGTDTDAQATELAMLKFIKRTGCDYQHQRQQYLSKDMLRFQFDSLRKRMSTVLEFDADDDEKLEHGYPKRCHTKGAAEEIIKVCSHYLNEQGYKTELNDQIRSSLDDIIKQYAKQALRCIAFSYIDLKENQGGHNHEAKSEVEENVKKNLYEIEERDHTLICLVGIKDIIREEVPDAIAMCNEAGVRVRMITGDNILTAIAIAKECHILKEGEEFDSNVVMLGQDFSNFVGGLVHKKTREEISIMGKEGANEVIGNLDNMKIIRKQLKVLARSRPNDKYIMVKGLRDIGDIVAVTGDGTNDAPALKKADVGFAMKTGTNVAHNAADIIIQDDNFASIVKACKWGRNVYDNIRRFLQFQLSVNVVALATAFSGACILWESPLAAIQLLWVNMIMDSLASLALATETPKDDLLKRPPYRKREYIVSRKMIKHILCMSIFQTIILFAIIFFGFNFFPEGVEGQFNVQNDPSIGITKLRASMHPVKKWAEWDYKYVMNGMVRDFDGSQIYEFFANDTPSRHLTIVFNVFVILQIFNMIAARKINDELNIFKDVTTNPMFMGVWLAICLLHFVIIQFGSIVMKCHVAGLTSEQWIWCLAIGFLALPINFVLKFVPDSIAFTMGDEEPQDVEDAAADYEELRSKAYGLQSFKQSA